MSKRSPEQKKRRRIAKALRRRKLPAYIDLVQYLVDRRMVPTHKAAVMAIDGGRVSANSHPLHGRYAPAELRGAITVKESNG